MAFAIVGLVGVFGVWAAPLPLQRGLARDELLAQIQAGVIPATDGKTLRARLGDSADAVLRGENSVADRAAMERVANLRRSVTEAEDIRLRLVIVIGVVCAAAALFGTMVLSIVRRR